MRMQLHVRGIAVANRQAFLWFESCLEVRYSTLFVEMPA